MHSSLRSGRVRIYITYGSKLVDLPVPMQVEYYTTDGWIANSADSCLSTALKALMNFQVNLNSGETCVQDTGTPGVSGQRCAVTELLAPVNERFLALPSAMALPPIDIYNLNLKVPGAGNDENIDGSTDLSTKTWLRYDCNGGDSESEPSGRTTFCLYRGSPRHIYPRQRYN